MVAVLLQAEVVLEVGVAFPGQAEEEVGEGHQSQVKVVVEGEVGCPNQAERVELLLRAKVVVEVVVVLQHTGEEGLETASVSPHLAKVEREEGVVACPAKSGPGMALLSQQKEGVLSRAGVVGVVFLPRTWE